MFYEQLQSIAKLLSDDTSRAAYFTTLENQVRSVSNWAPIAANYPIYFHPELVRWVQQQPDFVYINAGAMGTKEIHGSIEFGFDAMRYMLLFEPDRTEYERLSAEIAKLDPAERERFMPIEKGLYSRSCRLEFQNSAEGQYVGRLAENLRVRLPTADFVEIDCVSVDELAIPGELPIGVIKTDVEGAERALLDGAQKSIDRDRPALAISIYHTPSDYLDLLPLIHARHHYARYHVGFHGPRGKWEQMTRPFEVILYCLPT